MKKRDQIDNKYKWDLTKFVKSDEEWYKLLEKLKTYSEKLASFKGKLNDKETLLQYFATAKEMSMLNGRLSMYAHHNNSVDLACATYIEMGNVLTGVQVSLSESMSFYAPEMLSYDDQYFAQLLQDDRFINHHFSLANLQRSKPHVLSDKEEKLITATGSFAGEFVDIFHALTDVNLKFNNVLDKNGKEKKLDIATYSVYMRSKDRVLRKNAFKEFYRQFVNFGDTIATNYIASLKSDWFYSKTSNFESTLASALYPDNVNQKVYDKLVYNINNNLPLLQRYFALKAKSLKLNDFSYYDMMVSSTSLNKKVEFDQGMAMLYEALSVLGKEYIQLLKQSVSQKWIDIYPNKGKRSGAYQSGIYGTTPIVLLNYKNQIDDVFTTAHELGHAMHSYHSDRAQPWELADYTIFLAEVASTTNEIILLKHLYKKATTKKEKLYYLEYYLQMFKSTLFRQTMFAEFEEYAHSLVEQNKPISKTVLSNYYGELNKRYHGKSVKHDKNIDSEWMRVPHFYNSFYVYKYSTGITCAITLASRIVNQEPDALNKYIEFLSSGHKDYSVEILKRAGVNLETDEPYNTAFEEMKWALDEMEALLK